MTKKLCKEDKKNLLKKNDRAKFECKSCGEEAEKEKYLCKPTKI
jgi:hypothetical protein